VQYSKESGDNYIGMSPSHPDVYGGV